MELVVDGAVPIRLPELLVVLEHGVQEVHEEELFDLSGRAVLRDHGEHLQAVRLPVHPQMADAVEAVLRKQRVVTVAVGAYLADLLVEHVLGVVCAVPPEPPVLDPLHHGAVGQDFVGLALDVVLGLPPEHVWGRDGVMDVLREHALLAAAVRGVHAVHALHLGVQRLQHALHDALQHLPRVAPLGDLRLALQAEGVVVGLQGDPGGDVLERRVGVVVDAYGLVVLWLQVPDYVEADLGPVAGGQRRHHQLAAVLQLRALVRNAGRSRDVVPL
mmetsp:Transcript_25182/g.79365  ORF Transcript_25182/g.79365 Transcript_25182/m.79365 type:complete len:273 (-) Transcript_25182:334-1152(-)